MKRIFYLFVCLFCSFQMQGWESSYATAMEKSLEDKKPVLLFFTGSDWSGLGMMMKKEVLDTEVFESKIGPNFHCVQVDFPKYTPIGAEKMQENMQLKERFSVSEYPLVILLDSNEREIVRLGYFSDNSERFVDEVLHVVAQDLELQNGLQDVSSDENKLCHLYQIAQKLRRFDAEEALIAAGLSAQLQFFQIEKYRLLSQGGHDTSALRKTLLDSDDHHVHFTIAMIDFQERASNMRDPNEVIKPLEEYLSRFKDLDTQNVWRIEMMIAQFYVEADKWDVALKHATRAYKVAPKDMRSEIEGSLIYMREQMR